MAKEPANGCQVGSKAGHFSQFRVAKQFDKEDPLAPIQYFPNLTKYHGQIEIYKLNSHSKNGESKDASKPSTASTGYKPKTIIGKTVMGWFGYNSVNDKSSNASNKNKNDKTDKIDKNEKNKKSEKDRIKELEDDPCMIDINENKIEIIENYNGSSNSSNSSISNITDKTDKTHDDWMGWQKNENVNFENSNLNAIDWDNNIYDNDNTNNKKDSELILNNDENDNEIKTPDFPHMLDGCTLTDLELAQWIVTANAFDNGEWIKCDLYLHNQCIYVNYQMKKWIYLSKYHFELIKHSLNDKIENFDYFYWCDKNGFIIMARIIKDQTKNGNTNFFEIYESWKDDTSRNLSLQSIQKVWSFRSGLANLIKSNQDSQIDFNIIRREFFISEYIKYLKLYASSMYNLNDPIYQRNEFLYDLKCQLIDNIVDIRIKSEAIPSKNDEKHDSNKCMIDKTHILGTMKHYSKYTCYWCYKTGCYECFNHEMMNPSTKKSQTCCIECKTLNLKYFANDNNNNNNSNKPDNSSMTPTVDWSINKILNFYDAIDRQLIQFSKVKWSIVQEAALLCFWIYKPKKREHMLRACGLHQIKFVAANSNSQFIQYSICKSLLNENTYYLVFRGSYELMDWLTNAGALPLYINELGFKVHHGMWTSLQQFAFESILNALIDIITDNDKTSNLLNDPINLVITGHSLGGGYAQLTASYLLSNSLFGKNKNTKLRLAQVVTFASPVVIAHDKPKGNNNDSINKNKILKRMNDITVNFVYQFDIVPRLQIGMSFAYLMGFIKCMSESTMPWWLKLGDKLLFKGNIQGIVDSIVQRSDLKALATIQKESYQPVGKYCLLFDKCTNDANNSVSDNNGSNDNNNVNNTDNKMKTGKTDEKDDEKKSNYNSKDKDKNNDKDKDKPIWIGKNSLYMRELYGNYLFMTNENDLQYEQHATMSIKEMLEFLPRKNGLYPNQMIEEHSMIHYWCKIMFLKNWKSC